MVKISQLHAKVPKSHKNIYMRMLHPMQKLRQFQWQYTIFQGYNQTFIRNDDLMKKAIGKGAQRK